MLSWAIGRHIPTAFIVTTITVLPLNPLRYDWPVLVVGWSLGFELAFYLLVASVLSASRPSARLAGMLAFFAAATVLYPARPGTLAILTNPIQLEFLWGILAYVAYQKTKAERWSAWLGAASVFLGGSAILHSCVSGFPFSADYRAIIDGSSSLKRAIFWGLPWAAIVLGYLLLSNGKETQSLPVGHRFLHFVGEASYSLYLTHLMFCLAAEVLLPPSLIHPDVVIAGTFVLACSGGILFYVLIELPLLRSLAPRKESTHLSPTPPFPPVRSGRAR